MRPCRHKQAPVCMVVAPQCIMPSRLHCANQHHCGERTAWCFAPSMCRRCESECASARLIERIRISARLPTAAGDGAMACHASFAIRAHACGWSIKANLAWLSLASPGSTAVFGVCMLMVDGGQHGLVHLVLHGVAFKQPHRLLRLATTCLSLWLPVQHGSRKLAGRFRQVCDAAQSSSDRTLCGSVTAAKAQHCDAHAAGR